MVLFLFAACTAPGPFAPPPEPPRAPVPAVDGAVPTTVTTPTIFGEVEGIALLGDWTSGPCGGRIYARNISFGSDQRYAAIDLVSPCPDGTTCIWSGMTGFGGLWELQGKKVRVREFGVGDVPGGPRPMYFEATADGKLVENGCLYDKGLTVPPGYTEADVRPELLKK